MGRAGGAVDDRDELRRLVRELRAELAAARKRAAAPSDPLWRASGKSADTPIALLDLDFDLVDLNAAFALAFDVERSAVVGKHLSGLGARLGALVDTCRAVVASGQTRLYEAALGDSSTSTRVRVEPLRDDRKMFFGLQLVVVNRNTLDGEDTSTQLADSQLRRTQDRLHSLVDAVSQVVWTTDPTGKVIEPLPSWQRFTGQSFAQCEGEGWADAIHPDDRQHVLQAWSTALANRSSYQTECRIRRHDGEYRLMQGRGVPVLEGDGRVREWVGMHTDISDERRATGAAIELQRRHHEIMDRLPIMVGYVDADERYHFVNKYYESVFQTARRDILGKTVKDIIGAENYARASVHIKKALLGQQVEFDAPISFGAQPSPYDRARVLFSPDISDTGEVLGYYSFVVDVAEQRRLEAQLLAAQKMEAVGRLAGGVAHDFNNMLTVILSATSLLRSVPAMLGDSIEAIEEAAMRAAVLTRQLLAFAKKGVIEPRVVDLNDAIGNFQSMLMRLIGEDIEVVTRLHPDVGNILIDPGQLEQVFMNLAVNARDAMPSGGRLLIETRTAKLDAAQARERLIEVGEYVILSLSDTGTGMSNEVRTHLFEPFFTTKDAGKGTGLGLATCYGIVSQAGGMILVDSVLGEGTTFTTYLPRVYENKSPVQPSPAQSTSPALGGSETILLVEDDALVRNTASRALRELGYQVIEGSDGLDGLEQARALNRSIDLVVSDVIMPRMSGLELVAALREQKADTKVVFTSGYTDNKFRVRAGSHTAFLPKPYVPNSLARKIRSLLSD